MKTLLATGGPGPFGDEFARQLCADRQFQIVNLDKLTSADNLASLAETTDDSRDLFSEDDARLDRKPSEFIETTVGT